MCKPWPHGFEPLLSHSRASPEGETTSAGGIIIPDSAKEKPLEGVVVAVGTGKPLDDGSVREMSVRVDDKVLFAKYAETEIKIDGELLLLIRAPLEIALHRVAHTLSLPALDDVKFVALAPAEFFIAKLKVAAVAGLFLGSPWVTY